MSIMNDGHPMTIAFSASDSEIVMSTYLYEKEVTPPGVSAGGENDTSTMRNTTWRTKAPKSLKTLTTGSFQAAYDPAVIDEIIATCGVNQLITITYPDESTVAFWGWIDEFTPGAIVEGEQPIATVNMIPSNQNAAGVETAPLYEA